MSNVRFRGYHPWPRTDIPDRENDALYQAHLDELERTRNVDQLPTLGRAGQSVHADDQPTRTDK